MTSWLSEVTTLLQARLDADILAGEVPEEFEQVRAEFAQHEAVMASLKETCEVYRKEGKLEAAERCEQQTAVLKVTRKIYIHIHNCVLNYKIVYSCLRYIFCNPPSCFRNTLRKYRPSS